MAEPSTNANICVRWMPMPLASASSWLSPTESSAVPWGVRNSAISSMMEAKAQTAAST